MAFNQVLKYYQGYVASQGHTGGVIAGLLGLLVKQSTHLTGACTDYSGNIYVTDCVNHIILKITESGRINTIGGLSGVSGNNSSDDVTAAASRFNYPTGICCDRNGDIYVADTNNHQIRKISNNKVSLVAGAATPTSGTADGIGKGARFNTPYDIDIDFSGTIYVADTFNHAIRRIKGGVVTTIAGLRGTSGHAPVWAQMTTAQGITGPNARFNRPYSVSVGPTGYIYVGDTENHVIKRIDPAGNVRIFSGTGVFGRALGTAKTCQYQYLKYSDVDKNGDLYILDFEEGGLSRIVRVNEEGKPGNAVDYRYKTTGKYAAAVVCNPSSHLIVIESEQPFIEYSSSSSSEVENWSTSSSSTSVQYSSSSSSSYIENWSSSSSSS